MAVFATLSMTPADWAIASALILVGSTLQAATGIGLGLIAGPILVLTLGGSAAIFIAIMLNLALSLLLLPQESGEVLRSPLRLMAWGAIVGIPLGWLILQQMAPSTLRTVAGVIVLLAALQLLISRFRNTAGRATSTPGNGGPTLLLGGLISGLMCGCLAIPGPAALWAMLRCALPPLGVRATMRALFALSYGAAAAITFGLDGIAHQPWLETAVLLPGVLLGVALGLLIRRWIDAGTLGMVLYVVLLAIGVAMLWRSWLEMQPNA